MRFSAEQECISRRRSDLSPAQKAMPGAEITGLDEEPSKEVELVSKDGVRFALSRGVAQQSEYIKGAIELDDSVTEVVLEHTEGKTLGKIVEWLKYHKSTPSRKIPRPLKTSNMKEAVGTWDAAYVDCDLQVVFEVMLSANFLSIGPLVELCCAKVASLMLGKTPRQIRNVFDIREDFTMEEEEAIRTMFADFL